MICWVVDESGDKQAENQKAKTKQKRTGNSKQKKKKKNIYTSWRRTGANTTRSLSFDAFSYISCHFLIISLCSMFHASWVYVPFLLCCKNSSLYFLFIMSCPSFHFGFGFRIDGSHVGLSLDLYFLSLFSCLLSLSCHLI